jgi:SNF2 family DNA or RNA helicase
MAWHDTWQQMKTKPHVLVVVPQAVGPAWVKVITAMMAGDLDPWLHQQKAAAWASPRPASLLGMDMGTGKTLTALLALGLFGKKLKPVMLTAGATKKRAETLEHELKYAGSTPLAVIVNYDCVWRTDIAKVIEKVGWSAIVLDESHRIKSPTGKASRWLAGLARKHPTAKRLCLTGTPMPHSPLDLFGQFRFMNPEVFGGSFSAFRARYAECDRMFPSKVKKWIRQDELRDKLDEHTWRVSADDVLDLPDSIHETIPVVLSAATKKFYRTLERDMVAELEAGTVTAANALTRLLRLQQATSGYAVMDDGGGLVPIDGTPAKRNALEDWLEDLPSTEPVVVFCRFRSDLEDVAALARKLGRPYSEVSGVTKTLEQWQAGETTILGVQMQSGGVGIDLTRACFCVYYSLGFSLGDYEQSLARLRRPGQNKCCRYYHLVAAGTVDEEVYRALQERRNVVESVLQGLTPRREKENAA